MKSHLLFIVIHDTFNISLLSCPHQTTAITSLLIPSLAVLLKDSILSGTGIQFALALAQQPIKPPTT